MRWIRPVLLSVFLASVFGCATARTGNVQWCEAPLQRESGRLNATALTGRYELLFKATTGERSGRVARGVLELFPRDSASSVLLTLGGAPHLHLRELYFGAASIDLASVGAYTEGKPDSLDPKAPGVTIREWTDRQNGQLQLRLGSDTNRRDITMLDGAFIEANFLETRPNSFRGEWEASLGHTSYRSSGFFCGKRI